MLKRGICVFLPTKSLTEKLRIFKIYLFHVSSLAHNIEKTKTDFRYDLQIEYQ